MQTEDTQEGLVVGTTQKKHFPKKKVLIVVGVIIGLAALISLYLVTSDTSSDEVTICAGAGSSIITEDVSLRLSPDLISSHKQLVDEIEAREGYQTDQNCMYVTTLYYIHINDLAKARENFTILSDIYDETKGFDPNLGVTYSLNELSELIEVVEFNQQSRQEIYDNTERIDNGNNNADQ